MLVKAFLIVLAVAAATCIEVKTYPGKPVAIWSYATGNLQLNTNELDDIFAHKALDGRKIAIYAIDGAKLEMKSLFMDYMLRYMYKHFKSVASPETPFNHDHADSLGSQDEPLQGFTTNKRELGISMWSDIFLYDKPNGDKYAIVIVDSKGVSDPKWTYADNTMTFFLSSMVASAQIFNIKGMVEEKHLDYLKLVARFGEFGLEKKDEFTPFGSLFFLTRDSVDPHYGFEHGDIKLKNLLKVDDIQSSEQKALRTNIGHSFKTLSNYQMISAGAKVSDKDFDGRRSQLDNVFVEQMKDFAEKMFIGDKLIVKNIHGEDLVVSKYYAYIKKYAEIMKTDDLKSVAAIYDAKV